MTPTTDERLASIVRSLTEVILPHLPAEASLAQEQVHLAIGHLQILRAQIDGIHAFELEEQEDAHAIGKALLGEISGGVTTASALKALQTSVDTDMTDGRAHTVAINFAVDTLVKAVSTDGAAGAKAKLFDIILKHEDVRAQKDRKWFLPFGFDTMTGAA